MQFPRLEKLSFWGNKVTSFQDVMQCIASLPHLKALWLNDNPVAAEMDDESTAMILSVCPNLEILNSKFTPQYGPWALSFTLTKVNHHAVLDLSDRRMYNRITPSSLSRASDLPYRSSDIREWKADVIRQFVESHCKPSLWGLNLKGNPALAEALEVSVLPTLKVHISSLELIAAIR